MASNSKEVQKKADAKRAGTKARAWTAVVYPDSAPENWIEILREQLIECLISPLHDKDVEPTGEVKKAHYHVVLSFASPAKFEKACEIFSTINAVVPPENQSRVKDFKQMARYLCHLDQPNKHRYSIDDVVSIGSLEYSAFALTNSDTEAMLSDMEDFIYDHRIVSFTSFQRYCKQNKPEWLHVIRNKGSYYIRETIKANAWAIMNEDFISQVEIL